MNKKSLLKMTVLLMLCALQLQAAAPANSFPLEWNSKNDTSLPYETAIDRIKLNKLAGIPQNASIKVAAVTPDGEKYIETKILPGNTSGKEILRFTVPAGTQKLYAVAENTDKTLSCTNTADNLFAGALTDADNWKSRAKTTEFKTSGNKLHINVNSWGKSTAAYSVELPAGYAGTPAVFELEIMSRAKLTWGGAVRVEQFDKKGKLLPESLTEPRWISHMRIPGVVTHYQEYGFFHKDAKRIAVTFEFHSQRHANDNHGIAVKNDKDCLPKLEISKLAVRKAKALAFPAYNSKLFPQGVSGTDGDTALCLDGKTIFHYSTNSHAVYSEGKMVRGDKDCFWPLNDATVEVWLNPQWSKHEKNTFTLFDARINYGPRAKGKSKREKIDSVFLVTYAPGKSKWTITLFDGTNTHKSFSFNHKIDVKKWTHIAVQYGKGGVECFINGKKVFNSKKYNYTARKIDSRYEINDQIAQIAAVGNTAKKAREKMDCAPAALVDLFRVSGGKRYTGNFQPEKSFTKDAATYALFDFDRSIDGKTSNGLGIVYGSINSTTSFLRERTFVCNGKNIQYFPEKLLDSNNPDIVLNKNNYPVVPSVDNFKAARKNNAVKYSAVPGSKKELTIPANTYMDYIEIACPDNVKELRHPILIANNELDTRSFGDIADSLKDTNSSDRERVNRLFNLVLSASDYFMTHQAVLPAHSNKPKHASYQALTLFNSYCGFECGPLNNMAANMFSCSGMLPATQTSGYGHSFQQVYFDGKNHVYDLSAQRFFPSFDNETAASLKELDVENGAFQRYGHGGSSFSRQGSTRGYSRHIPGMQKRIAYTLHPGEKMRFYFYNDGNYNDLQTKRCIDKRAVHPNDPFPYPIEFRLAKEAPEEVVSTEQLYQVHRPFPHYSNAYFSFSGKPEKSNKAFSKITSNDFCYLIDLPYPIVAASYKAVTVDGNEADIEISTDGGKSFRKLVTDADGRATYAVRARHAYYIKIKAPISKVAKFDAYTEVMFNSRVQNCKLKEGKNVILFKAEKGNNADITIAYRHDVKELVIQDAPYSGGIPGFERQLTAVEPGKSVSHAVTGASSKAFVTTTSGISASLENEKLTVTAKEQLPQPRFENVVINDNGAKKELTVLVSENVRLVLAKDAKLAEGAKLAAANANCIQDCAVVKNAGELVTFNFQEIPSGDYTVWVLSRMNTMDTHARTSRKVHGRDLSMVMPDGSFVHSISGINTGTEFYKAKYGNGKGRFRWDAPIDNDHNKFPYFSPRWTTLDKTGHITLRMNRTYEIEIAAILVTPRTDNATRCELVKILCGLNCEPWKISEFQKK